MLTLASVTAKRGTGLGGRNRVRENDINGLNHALRRMLWNRGDYVRPIELVSQHLTTRG